MYLKPSEITYSQDSIARYFDKKSAHYNKRIGETLDDICDGRCSISQIPTISVKKLNTRWVTADNRRLWIFRQLERLGKCDEIHVYETHYIPASKMTSYNGDRIDIRGDPWGKWHRKISVSNTRYTKTAQTKHRSPVVYVKSESSSDTSENKSSEDSDECHVYMKNKQKVKNIAVPQLSIAQKTTLDKPKKRKSHKCCIL